MYKYHLKSPFRFCLPFMTWSLFYNGAVSCTWLQNITPSYPFCFPLRRTNLLLNMLSTISSISEGFTLCLDSSTTSRYGLGILFFVVPHSGHRYLAWCSHTKNGVFTFTVVRTDISSIGAVWQLWIFPEIRATCLARSIRLSLIFSFQMLSVLYSE